MEDANKESEHHSVDRNDFISNIHYLNEVDFYNEFDKLIDKYEFLLDIEEKWEDIPKDTHKRYDVLKKSAAQYYFLHYLQEYRDLTLRSEIKGVVNGLYRECKKFIDDPRLLKDNPEYSLTYLNATRFINEFVAKGRTNAIKEHSEDEIKTYLYLLHKEEYFNLFPIPDESFDVNSDSPYSIIAEVYAHYFLFFEKFIEPDYNKQGTKEEDIYVKGEIKIRGIKNRHNHEASINNKETRTIFALIKPEYKVKFAEILEILSDYNPLAKVADNLKLDKHKKSELLLYTNPLYYYHTKMVYKVFEDKIYVDESYKNLKSFLSHLFAYLYHCKWIRTESISAISRVINNSIYSHTFKEEPIPFDRAQFSGIVSLLMKNKNVNNKYLEFIKMIIAGLK